MTVNSMWKDSHYAWLEENLDAFFISLGMDIERYGNARGWNIAHGDKCYQYRDRWAQHGIPFPHGVAIYYLTYTSQYGKESRETDNGWVAPCDWVIDNYTRFKPHLKPME